MGAEISVTQKTDSSLSFNMGKSSPGLDQLSMRNTRSIMLKTVEKFVNLLLELKNLIQSPLF